MEVDRMELENTKEYEYTRSETELIRTCITTYMGYALGGSGAALFGLAGLRVIGNDNRIGVGFVAFAVSVLVSTVLTILFYKFNSHNRYAGYSLVLADEMYEAPPDAADESKDAKGSKQHDASHVAWELCMERIRVADRLPGTFRDLARDHFYSKPNDSVGVDLYKWMLERYLPSNGLPPPADHGKHWGGLRHLLLALAGRTRTTSWAFPPPVVAVFFLLMISYFGIGVYQTAAYSFAEVNKETPFLALLVIGFVVLVLQVNVWRALCGKLFALMSGSATVDAFAFRFAIARAIYLNRVGVIPRYPSIKVLIQEDKERVEHEQARRLAAHAN
jgi:hypothetical protein